MICRLNPTSLSRGTILPSINLNLNLSLCMNLKLNLSLNLNIKKTAAIFSQNYRGQDSL